MTEIEIIRKVADHFGVRRNLCVANISWGFVTWGECDLLVCTPCGYLTEVEVKTSVADLRKEKTKKRWLVPEYRQRFDEIVSRYFVAVPSKIIEKTNIADYPEFAGILEVVEFGATVVRRAAKRLPGKGLTKEEMYKLARLGAMKYWFHSERLLDELKKKEG